MIPELIACVIGILIGGGYVYASTLQPEYVTDESQKIYDSIESWIGYVQNIKGEKSTQTEGDGGFSDVTTSSSKLEGWEEIV